MSASGYAPPAEDRAVGIEFYLSRSPGVPGRLKSDAGAFQVREISEYPPPVPDGPFTILRIESANWEQHDLADAVARAIGLPRGRLRWSGTKDRRAVAERLFSYRGPPPSVPLDLPGATVVDVYRSRVGLELGRHYGNSFTIEVDQLDAPWSVAGPRYAAVEEELRAAGGFPNFFGRQRFGEVRPVTAAVGRELVAGRIDRALDVYLADLSAAPAGPGADARREYARHHDPVRALREFPRHFTFERAILRELANGRPPERALGALSRELRTLFVHAYQSLLFNRWLSIRWRSGLSVRTPEPGDRIVVRGRDGTIRASEPIPVTADNESECRALVARGTAWLAGPLVGYGSDLGDGAPRELIDRVLEDEQVTPTMFRLPNFPDLASRGTWRPALVAVPRTERSAVADPAATGDGGGRVRFAFALPKGAYATVYLREFLKTGATAVP